jgi:hypothetical protein
MTKNNNETKKKYRLIIPILAVVIVIIAALTTVFKDDIPEVYYSIHYGNSLNVDDKQLVLNDGFFFLSDNTDIKKIAISSAEFIDRTPIMVILPTRISIPKAIELGKLNYHSDVLEQCKLYKFGDADEFVLFNEKTNIGFSFNNDYMFKKEQKSICKALS